MGNRSYEIYSFKQGNWNIDSVHDDKQQALYEARILLESKHLTGVKVIEEQSDDSGDTLSKIVFQKQKGEEDRKKPEKAKSRSGSAGKKITKRKKKKGGMGFVLLLVICVGGIGLGLLSVLFFVMQALG